jgi:hypothetical protein
VAAHSDHYTGGGGFLQSDSEELNMLHNLVVTLFTILGYVISW